MPLPPELPPTPWPGAKPSAASANTGDPRAATDKATPAEQSAANKPAEPTPAERASQIKEHATALEQVFGKPQAPAGKNAGDPNQQSISDVIDKALAGTKANPDPEYQ